MSKPDERPGVEERPLVAPPPVSLAHPVDGPPTHASIDAIRFVDEMAMPINRIGRLNKGLMATIAKYVEDTGKFCLKRTVVDGVVQYALKEGTEGSDKECSKADLLTSFVPIGTLTPLAKKFGIKIDYTFNSGKDIMRLSTTLREVSVSVMDCIVDDYDTKGMAQCRMMTHNMLILFDNLSILCDLLKVSDTDSLQEKETALTGINAKLLHLHETLKVPFEPSKVAPPPALMRAPSSNSPMGLRITPAQWSALKEWVPSLGGEEEAAVLYRMSENSASPYEFHWKCDGKGPTLTVFETSEGSKFGGFVSQSWSNKSGYCDCPDAFIFSLVNPHRPGPPTKYPVKEGGKRAIKCGQRSLACFGGEVCDINACDLQGSAPGKGKGEMFTYPGGSYDAPKDALSGEHGTWWYTDITVIGLAVEVDPVPAPLPPNFKPPRDGPLGLQINSTHWSALKKWLPALGSDKEVELLYRMSDHGASPEEFHKRCDGKGSTLTVFETSEGSVFGGFTCQSWSSEKSSCTCPDTFIFSLVNPHRGNQPTRYPIKDKGKNAIYCGDKYHPNFGGLDADIVAYELKGKPRGVGKGNMYTNPGVTFDAPKNALSGERGTWVYTDIAVIKCPPPPSPTPIPAPLQFSTTPIRTLSPVTPQCTVPLGLDITSAQWLALLGWLPSLGSEKEASVLYRMSEHGADPEEFHSRCDGVGPTLTIFETSEGSIFGGFASCSWTSTTSYGTCPDAFIFSLANPNLGSPPTKYPIKGGGKNAIFCSFLHHPNFGFGYSDINAYKLQKSAPDARDGEMFTNPGVSYDAPWGSLSGERGTWWYTDITVISWPCT